MDDKMEENIKNKKYFIKCMMENWKTKYKVIIYKNNANK